MEVKDDLDFKFNDDFGGDFDNLTLDVEQPKADRNPVAQAATSAVDTVITRATDTQRLKEDIRKALPSGYSTAINFGEQQLNTLDRAKREMLQPIRKELPAFKRNLNKLTPTVTRLFGSRIGEKFGNLTATRTNMADIDPDKAEIQQGINAAFGGWAQLQESIQTRQLSQDLINSQTEEQRFNLNYELFASIDGSARKAQAFRESVTFENMKQTLDLNYKKYHLLKALVKVNTESFGLAITELRNITKNTGLPELVKQRNSEVFRKLFMEEWQGRTVEKAVDFGRDFFSRWGANLTSRAKEFGASIADQMAQVGDAAGMYADIQADSPEQEQISLGKAATTQAGKYAGNYVGSRVIRYGQDKLRDFLTTNQRARRLNKQLRLATTNRISTVTGFANDQIDRGGLLGSLLGLLMDSAPTLARDRESAKVSLAKDATAAAQWDQIQRETIVTIIPGWLSKIHVAIRELLDGKGNVSPETFDILTQKFVTEKEATANALKHLVTKDERTELNEVIKDVVTELFQDVPDITKEMQDSALKLLRDELVDQGRNKPEIDFEALLSPSTYKGKGNKTEITNLVEVLNKLLNDEGDDGLIGLGTLSDEGLDNRTRLANAFKNIGGRGAIGELQTRINTLDRTGNLDRLRQGGLLKDDNTLDYDALNRLLYEDPNTPTAGGSGPTPPPNPSGKGPKGWFMRGKGKPAPIQPQGGGSAVAVDLGAMGEKLDNIASGLKPLSAIAAYIEERKREDRAKDAPKDEWGMLGSKLDVLHEDGMARAETLEGIRELVDAISQGQYKGGYRPGKIVRGLGRGVKRVGLAGGKFIKGYYNALINTARTGGRWAGKAASWAGGLFTRNKDRAKNVVAGTYDIYLAGGEDPVLYGKDIARGIYFNYENGKIVGKAIQGVKDIHGAVFNIETETVVVTKQDFDEKGLYVRRNGVFHKLTGLAGKVLKFQFNLPMTILGRLKKGWDWAKKQGGELLEMGRNGLNRLTDFYDANGKLVLTAQALRNREYYYLVDGKPVYITDLKSLLKVTGAIYHIVDGKPEVAVTEEQVSRGLRRVDGTIARFRSIKAGVLKQAGKVLKFGGKVFASPLRLLRMGGSAIKNMLKVAAAKAHFIDLPDNVIFRTQNVYIYSDNAPGGSGGKGGPGLRPGGGGMGSAVRDRFRKAKDAKESGSIHDAIRKGWKTAKEKAKEAPSIRGTITAGWTKVKGKAREAGDTVRDKSWRDSLREKVRATKERMKAKLPSGVTAAVTGRWRKMKESAGESRILTGFKEALANRDTRVGKLFGRVSEQLSNINKERKSLFERLRGKKVKGDSDGDGIRDGSWKDLLKKRKERAAKLKAAKEARKEKLRRKRGDGQSTFGDKLLGALASIGGILASGFGLVKDTGMMALSALLKYTGLAGAGAVLKGGAKWVGRQLLKVAVPAVTQVAKRAVAGGAAAIAAGTAAAPIVVPILLIGSAVWAVWDVGSAIYGYFDRRSAMGSYEYARHLSYGYYSGDEDIFKDRKVNLRYFEKEILDLMTTDEKGRGVLEKTPTELWKKYASDFDGEADDQAEERVFTEWFLRRFKPVLFKWFTVVTAFTVNGEKDGWLFDADRLNFSTLDTNLAEKDKKAFLAKVMDYKELGWDPLNIGSGASKAWPIMARRTDIEKYVDKYLLKLTEVEMAEKYKPKKQVVPGKDKAVLYKPTNRMDKDRKEKLVSDLLTRDKLPAPSGKRSEGPLPDTTAANRNTAINDRLLLDATTNTPKPQPTMSERFAANLANPKTGDIIDQRISKYDSIITAAAAKYGVDEALIKRVIRQESSGRVKALSSQGAAGLMQLMPVTAREVGVSNRFDPTQNIMGGTWYLKKKLDEFDGDVKLALAAYNAGAGNVRKAIRVAGDDSPEKVLAALPQVTGRRSKETLDYVAKITKSYDNPLTTQQPIDKPIAQTARYERPARQIPVGFTPEDTTKVKNVAAAVADNVSSTRDAYTKAMLESQLELVTINKDQLVELRKIVGFFEKAENATNANQTNPSAKPAQGQQVAKVEPVEQRPTPTPVHREVGTGPLPAGLGRRYS